MWRTACIGLAVCGAVLVSVFGPLRIVLTGNGYGGDFHVFHAAATAPLATVYLPRAGVGPFAYPPTALLLVRPFGLLPFLAALLVWCALGAAAFIMAARALTGDSRTIALAIISPSFVIALLTGQTSLFVAALMMAGLVSGSIIGGVLFGAAAAIKPQMLILLPVALAAAGQWRTLVSTVAAGTALVLLAILIWGVHPWVQWIASLDDFRRILKESGIEARGATPTAMGLPWFVGLPLALAVVWTVFSRSMDAPERLVALVCGGALVSPYMLHYDLAGLSVGAGALLLRDRLSVAVGAMLALTYVLAGAGLVILAAALLWQHLASISKYPLIELTGRRRGI